MSFNGGDVQMKQVFISRQLYKNEQVKSFDDEGNGDLCKTLSFTLTNCCKKKLHVQNVIRLVLSFFPVLLWLPKYQLKKDLAKDVSAGLTLGIIQIPQGMAYAMLATLPPIIGLYTSFVPVLVYFIFGSSRHLSVGTFAITSLMTAEVINEKVNEVFPTIPMNVTADDFEQSVTEFRVELAVTMAFVIGVMQIFLGFFRVSFVTIYLSDPLISGFTTGAAFHVLSSQLKHLFGMQIPRNRTAGFFGLFKLYYYIFEHFMEINYGAFLIGFVCIILLFILKYITQRFKLKFPVPAELIVVTLGTGLSYGCKFNEKFNIPVLKHVPKGLPPVSVPQFHMMNGILMDCAVITILNFAINISMAKVFAKRQKYVIDTTQELYAYGMVNIISSFFTCFVPSGSLSRSVIQESLGSTQIAGVISCSLILLVLVAIAPVFAPLPRAILASIVLVALKGLFIQFTVVKPLWKVSKLDAFIWVSTFSLVLCLGVDIGLASAVFVNLLVTVVRTSRPNSSTLKNLKGTEIYLGSSNKMLLDIPGVNIFQYHAPLCYANVEHFQALLYKKTVNPIASKHPVTHETEQTAITLSAPESSLDQEVCSLKVDKALPVIHTVILDCSYMPYIDSMGVNVLTLIASEFKNINVNFCMCNCTDALYKKLQYGGYSKTHGTEYIFVTVHDAVQCSLLLHQGEVEESVS